MSTEPSDTDLKSTDARSTDLKSAASEASASATPASGQVPLRRPRDGRRGRGRSASGPIPVGGSSGETTTTASPRRGTAAAKAAKADPLPSARPGGTPASGLTGPIRQLLGPMTGSLRLGVNRDSTPAEQRMRVDWPQCKAHGLCAEIAPEIIHLDEWGYPLFDPGAVTAEDLGTARKAVQVCPTLALRLVDLPPPPRP